MFELSRNVEIFIFAVLLVFALFLLMSLFARLYRKAGRTRH